MLPAITEEKPVLYMWAIVPPPDLAQRIETIRKAFSENFQCYKALKPPVHLTLYKPFQAADDLVSRHIDSYKSWLSTQPAFSLTLKNFGFFERSRHPVVFIDVVPNNILKELNAELSRKTVKIFGLEGGKSDFHPHFTIGYRDVSPSIFPDIKKAYGRRPFSAAFDVAGVYLFRHNGLKWELLHECALRTAHNEQRNLF